jgi:septal ring factor EnvC (AmiA/AmiB activator)
MSLTPLMGSGSPEDNPKETKDGIGQAAQNPDGRLRLYGILLAIALLIGAGGGIYAAVLSSRLQKVEHEMQDQIAQQAESLSRLRNRLGATEEEFADLNVDLTTAKNTLGTTQIDLRKTRLAAEQLAKEQKETKELLSGQLGALAAEQDNTRGSVGSLTSEVSGVRMDVSTTKQDLASTRSELQRVIGDLGVQSGLVAHNREELEELRQRGEREYFEFDLRKSRQPQKYPGSLALQLKKTDVKRQKYTLDLVADDRRIEKKDRTANEPVQFYQAGQRIPTEIVVNQIYKDRIVGYISVPKQSTTRLSGLESAQPTGSGS